MKSPLRALILVIALTFAFSLFGGSSAQRRPRPRPKPINPAAPDCGNTNVNAATALNALIQGNVRWRGTMNSRNWAHERTQTATCQKPYAIVLSCMDARVPPELVFDRGLGEVFVIRVAAPVLDDDQKASLEYALTKKNVKLVVVLGHTDCGAVHGAVAGATGEYLTGLLDKLKPAINHVKDRYNNGRPLDPTDALNLNRVSLTNAKILRDQVPTFGESGVVVKWGLYYTNSGRVAFDPINVDPQ